LLLMAHTNGVNMSHLRLYLSWNDLLEKDLW
jgi:hypothetical protein